MLVRLAGELPTGIVVVTDGRDNASKLTLDEAARQCRDKGVPLHIYGVGSSEAGVLQMKEVKTPRTVFIDEKVEAVDDPVEIPVRFRCRGFKKGTIVLTVKLGEATVTTETFPVQEGENLTRVDQGDAEEGQGRRAKRPGQHPAARQTGGRRRGPAHGPGEDQPGEGAVR